jgi:hypothetical protein
MKGRRERERERERSLLGSNKKDTLDKEVGDMREDMRRH